MAKFKDLSIRWKLIVIIIAIVVQTLVLASGAFVYKDLEFFKKDMVRSLRVLASTVGFNSRASLVFQDSKTANNNLMSLMEENQIKNAALYDAEGNLFAQYVRDKDQIFQHPQKLVSGDHFYKDHVEIIYSVVLESEVVGTIYLNADLKELDRRLRAYLMTMGIILLASLAVSIALSLRLQAIISSPILFLSKTMRRISGSSDYSVRVERQSPDELGELFSGFNEMLQQIEARDEELAEYRKSLEGKIDECRLAGERLKKNEEATRTILDNAFDAIITVDQNGVVQTWNQRATQIFGWHSGEIKGKKLIDTIIPERYRKVYLEGLDAFVKNGIGRILNRQIELSALRRDGLEIPVELAISSIQRDGEYIFTGIVRDITERKRAQERLIRTQEQLRNLSRRLQTAREAEKSHIAREIHDELGQNLTALKIDLSWMNKHLAEGQEPVTDKLITMTELVENTILMVQRIASELRPQILDILGLCEALRWQAKEFQKRTGIPCKLDIVPDQIEIDAERSIAVFRIFQEALTNIARHANATLVLARFGRDKSEVKLRVKDNGQGMDETKVEDPLSLGLIGIRERTLVWGGRTKIESTPGHGTLIDVSIPMEES